MMSLRYDFFLVPARNQLFEFQTNLFLVGILRKVQNQVHKSERNQFHVGGNKPSECSLVDLVSVHLLYKNKSSRSWSGLRYQPLKKSLLLKGISKQSEKCLRYVNLRKHLGGEAALLQLPSSRQTTVISSPGSRWYPWLQL